MKHAFMNERKAYLMGYLDAKQGRGLYYRGPKVKLFDPTGGGTWYLASFNLETSIAFIREYLRGAKDFGAGKPASPTTQGD